MPLIVRTYMHAHAKISLAGQSQARLREEKSSLIAYARISRGRLEAGRMGWTYVQVDMNPKAVAMCFQGLLARRRFVVWRSLTPPFPDF